MKFTACIPFDIKSGNAIKKRWQTYAGYKRKVFKTMAYFLRPLAQREEGITKVTIIRYFAGRKRAFDFENLTWGCKPIFDYLKQTGHLKDDSPAWCKREYFQEKAAENSFTVIMEK